MVVWQPKRAQRSVSSLEPPSIRGGAAAEVASVAAGEAEGANIKRDGSGSSMGRSIGKSSCGFADGCSSERICAAGERIDVSFMTSRAASVPSEGAIVSMARSTRRAALDERGVRDRFVIG